MRQALAKSILCILAIAALAGCPSQPVREDRKIQSTAHADALAFQHGRKGVFLRDAGELRRIFQPDEEVIATSAPLFSPRDDRAIFCTAERVAYKGNGHQGDAATQPTRDGNLNPAGGIYGEQRVRYTCWLRETGDEAVEPVQLFTAVCGHGGYVAANLAVRWDADAEHIWYIEETTAGRHRLMRFALASGASQPIEAPVADAIALDVSPGGDTLVCAAASREPNAFLDGLWVKQLSQGHWWHVDGSQHLAAAPLDSLIERLRATLPVWRPAPGEQGSSSGHAPEFIYVGSHVANDGGPDGAAIEHIVSLVSVPKQSSQELLRDFSIVGDMCWHPSGEYLALVRAGENGARLLHTLSLDGELGQPLSDIAVRRFAGWDNAGELFAFTTAEPMRDKRCWATLLQPSPGARDVVYVGEQFDRPTREVFSGMRVTFPTWSRRDRRLTLWATFTPTYRLIFPWNMPWGDPAAVLDPATGEIEWMTVDAPEQRQVAHWHLLNKEYEAAADWYEKANAAEADSDSDNQPNEATALQDATDRLLESICVAKLGRDEEAQTLRAAFDRFFDQWTVPDSTQDQDGDQADGSEVLHSIWTLANCQVNPNWAMTC